MIILRLLRLSIGTAYYSRAVREINPMDPDVGKVITRQLMYSEQLKETWSQLTR